MTNKTILIALLALACAAPAHAQSKTKVKIKGSPSVKAAKTKTKTAGSDWSAKYAEQVNAERLRTHLAVLASDEYEGRETGTKGQHMAATYVAEQFKKAGLTGPVPNAKDPYQQPFNVEQVTWADGATLKVGSTNYVWLTDFYGLSDSPFAEETTVKPLFVGYGIEQPGYSDYADLDVKDQDLLIALGEPTTSEGKAVLSADGSPTKWGNDYRAKAQLATQKGARSVFFVSFNPTSNFAKQAARLTPFITRPATMMVADKAADKPSRTPSFFVSGRGPGCAGHHRCRHPGVSE